MKSNKILTIGYIFLYACFIFEVTTGFIGDFAKNNGYDEGSFFVFAVSIPFLFYHLVGIIVERFDLFNYKKSTPELKYYMKNQGDDILVGCFSLLVVFFVIGMITIYLR
tara:strand:+ start:65 stop:391 length:327 start_codon:yes stop_codon:yes gene_type:complete